MHEAGNHLVGGQRSEPEAGTTRLERRDDLGQVVTDDAEPRVLCELLNDCREKYQTCY